MPREWTAYCLSYVLWTVALSSIPFDPLPCAAEEKPAGQLSPDASEFFETKVRPLLAEHCFECHSSRSKTLQAGLRLDSRTAMLTGGDSGEVIIPGKPNESPLVHAIRWQSSEMPPRGKLREEQIAVLVKWIEMGAPWPVGNEAPVPAEKSVAYDWEKLRTQHWAWQPIRRPALPPVNERAWPQNEIDVFVLARLEAAGLKPAAPASARVLVRRLYFDLVGLPPSPAEIESFEQAASRDRAAAIRDLADRLLSSSRYGERWGRHWLDVARYNDGYGGDFDDKNQPQPNAWRYRDWVVTALNRDMPFDEFIRLQLAGDLVGPQHAAATGFLALGPKYVSDGGDPDSVALASAETLDDRVDTLARGLLGLTVSCARCHDHKFDPIPQLDYYSLAGVFRNARVTEVPLVAPEIVKSYDDYQHQIKLLEEKIRGKPAAAAKEKRQLTDEERAEIAAWKAELARLKQNAPGKYPFLHAVADAGASDMELAIRGNPRKPGPVAPRRFLRIVAGENTARFTHGSGRLELADAVVSRANPLTSRVFVNRVWQWYFGQGLVRTPSNFGKLGETPTHPELLDWLAYNFMSDDFMSGGAAGWRWSLKRLHRQIVCSAAYQMDSRLDPGAFAVDGDNRLLWRMNPRRLDVEAWRDALLHVTGELDEASGGPPTPNIGESRRRTLYASISRKGDVFESDRFLRLFDFPQARTTSEGRTSSVVPQQSLFLMNSGFVVARARALAARLEREAATDSGRIELAYRLLYARPVTSPELERGLQFVAPQASTAGQQLSAWQQYAQVLLSASELMYLK